MRRSRRGSAEWPSSSTLTKADPPQVQQPKVQQEFPDWLMCGGDEEAVTGFANLLEFARINAAYEVLADPRRRRQYDDFGAKLQPGVGDGFAAMVQCALRLGRLRRYRGSESCGSCRYGAAGDRRWLGGHHRRHVCVGAVDASDGHVRHQWLWPDGRWVLRLANVVERFSWAGG